MPEICRFYGFIIRMFLIDKEHPPRHIHIKYGVRMKLATFEQRDGFRFALTFDNGDRATVDLEPLIGDHISVDELGSAEIDPDWGCLQFQGGMVDIEPTTLYRYAMHSRAESTGRAPAAAQPAHQAERLPAGRR